ncbi:MAG: ATP synthase F0 subunit C [Armatimonadetes bacterium]|nr:ATP synthase F0 subunit C [Armatimonadota bacterium]
MLYFFGLALATGLAVAIAAFGGGLAQGRAIAAALEATARQPEAGGRLFSTMIVGLALIESLVIYALVISFVLWSKLPPAEEVLAKIAGG